MTLIVSTLVVSIVDRFCKIPSRRRNLPADHKIAESAIASATAELAQDVEGVDNGHENECKHQHHGGANFQPWSVVSVKFHDTTSSSLSAAVRGDSCTPVCRAARKCRTRTAD